MAAGQERLAGDTDLDQVWRDRFRECDYTMQDLQESLAKVSTRFKTFTRWRD
jgi:hypothetical protein